MRIEGFEKFILAEILSVAIKPIGLLPQDDGLVNVDPG